VLVSVAFYVSVGLVVVLVAVACIASIICSCLSVCGLGFRSAVDGIVEIIYSLLTLSEEEPEVARGRGTHASGQTEVGRGGATGGSEEDSAALQALGSQEGPGRPSSSSALAEGEISEAEGRLQPAASELDRLLGDEELGSAFAAASAEQRDRGVISRAR
jgi:hypothetical protein